MFVEETKVKIDFRLKDNSQVSVFLVPAYGSLDKIQITVYFYGNVLDRNHFLKSQNAFSITNLDSVFQTIVNNLNSDYKTLKDKLVALYKTEGVDLVISEVKVSDKYKDEDGSRAYTPFGVLVGDAGALKSFDDESFYEEVLRPSEKEQLKKNKEDFLKDPDAKGTVQEVTSSWRFVHWNRPVIKSAGRNALVMERILSNTWALNKDAIPDFIDLVEKLRQKYSTVLGDNKLLEHLEAAQHRARELEAGADVPEAASTSSTSSRRIRNSSRKIQSAMDDVTKRQNIYGCNFDINAAMAELKRDPNLDMYHYAPVVFQVAMWFNRGGLDKALSEALSRANSRQDESEIKKGVKALFRKWQECKRGSPARSGFVRSGAEGVDQQAYDTYIQQLIQKGIPEEQARQMADNIANQIRQNTAQFAISMNGQQDTRTAQGLTSCVRNNIGGKVMSKRIIKSDAFEDEDNDEALDEGGGSDFDAGSDDLGFDSPDEEGTIDFGEGENLDESFMDDVNSIEDFGANSPSLSTEEVVDAVEAIGQIVDTILATEGSENSGLSSEEIGYTLDEVDDLAAGYDSADEGSGEAGADLATDDFSEEPLTDEEVDEEFPEELSASLVRVVQAGKPVVSKFKRPVISSEVFKDENALVCQGIRSSFKVSEDEPAKDVIFSTLVLSHVPELTDKTAIKTGYIKVGAFKDWIKQSKGHRRAWRIASAKVGAMLNHKPVTSSEKSVALALASNYYDKWFKKSPGNLDRLFSGRSARTIRRVNLALLSRFTGGKSLRIIKQDYNGYRNYETWNAALYINKDKGISSRVQSFIKSHGSVDYEQVINGLGLANQKTPDGISWSDSKIDREQMGNVLENLMSSFKFNKGKGMEVKSNTQVDTQGDLVTVQDDTKTGIDLSNETPKSPEIEDPNTTRLTRVDGGDTSEIVDVHNTGDDGTLEADEKAGTENSESEYGFDSLEMVGVELPIEEENNTQVLELKHIGSGIYILNRVLEAPGAGRITFARGLEGRRLLNNNTRPSTLRADVNKVITLKNSKNALLLRSSAVLGVIGVEAPFSKGLKNAKYSVFCRSGLNLINEDGYRISSTKGPQRVIASAVSVKAQQQHKEKRDIFSEVESAYIGYLKGTIRSLIKANANLRNRYSALQSSFMRQKASARDQIASAFQSLDSIKTQSAADEAQRAMVGSAAAIQSASKEQAERQKRNVDFLASLYLR